MRSPAAMTQYAELHCLSNFTFLRGASHPQELVERAHSLGYSALAITDECSVAGVVRAHLAAKPCALPLIIGSEIRLRCGLTSRDEVFGSGNPTWISQMTVQVIPQ